MNIAGAVKQDMMPVFERQLLTSITRHPNQYSCDVHTGR